MEFNFGITSQQEISKYFLRQNIINFSQAAKFVQNLPYTRNKKDNKLCVLDELSGTCSTKHALLKELALENNNENLKLMLCIFNMNARNTPKISNVLERYNLIEMPEAHHYLKIGKNYFDFTRKGSKPDYFLMDLVEEIEIQPLQINSFKVEFHKNYLRKYLEKNIKIKYNLDEFWKIREECIGEIQK